MSARAALGPAYALAAAPGTAPPIFSSQDGSASGDSSRIVKLIGRLQLVRLSTLPNASTRPWPEPAGSTDCHRNHAPVPPVLSGRDQAAAIPTKANLAPAHGRRCPRGYNAITAIGWVFSRANPARPAQAAAAPLRHVSHAPPGGLLSRPHLAHAGNSPRRCRSVTPEAKQHFDKARQCLIGAARPAREQFWPPW